MFAALAIPQHVKECFEGPDGIHAGLTEGNTWIDHSTTDYEQTQEFVDKARDAFIQSTKERDNDIIASLTDARR